MHSIHVRVVVMVMLAAVWGPGSVVLLYNGSTVTEFPSSLPTVSSLPAVPLSNITYSDELGLNVSQESIHTTLKIGDTNRSINTVEIEVAAYREECQKGTCMYRAYLEGPAKLGTYLHHALLPSSNDVGSCTYKGSMQLYEPGQYRLLVLLEALRNASETTDFRLDLTAVCGSRKKGICMAERVSRSEAGVRLELNPTTDLPLYQNDPNAYQTSLPACRYDIESVKNNFFEWIPRSTLEKRGFTSQQTLLVPARLMPPLDHRSYSKRDIQYFKSHAKNTSHPEWIQPNQHLVWHSRTCRQRWISPEAVADWVASSVPNGRLKLVLLGTSRTRDTHNLLHSYLNLGGNQSRRNRNNIETEFVDLQVQDSTLASMRKRLVETNTYCPLQPNETSSASSTLVLVVSHGIWEATFHDRPIPFRFRDNAQQTIEFLKETCRRHPYKIVLMTNPATHVFDGRIANVYQTTRARLPKDNYLLRGSSMPLRHARINVANYAWKEMAVKFQLPLVDAEAISFPRYETVRDDTHYRLPFIHGKADAIGNEVTMTFVQSILSSLFDAFDEDSPS